MARFDSLFDWLSWQESFHPRSIDLGLERAATVFKLLNPDGIKPPAIIVGGTNGKGSCIAYLEAIYRAQGYKVGAYTSPHILNYNERICINGEPVSDSVICQAFERIDAVRNDVSLSYFEFGTLAALDIFSRSELDVQLLEVGLGGRLDAVNIIDADVSIVTNISVDHIDWLGETTEAIGFEKAGIFRKNKAAIIGDINPPKSLAQQANKIHAQLLRMGQEFDFQPLGDSWEWECFSNKPKKYSQLPNPALKGEHQYRNASAVLMAVTEMDELLPVSEQSIYYGLEHIELQGRFQIIKGKIPVLLDVAHNPQAVTALLKYLESDFPEQKIHAVFAMMKDKDIVGVINIIKPVITDWFLSPLSNPRAAHESLMQTHFQACQLTDVNVGFKDFSEAFNAAEKTAKQGDLIVVFGSFFLVSEYLLKAKNT
ncbi:MAG: bifunctional tetrahydrofolate synthase/dihydrofolate synthase [Methylococcales bacterium]